MFRILGEVAPLGRTSKAHAELSIMLQSLDLHIDHPFKHSLLGLRVNSGNLKSRHKVPSHQPKRNLL
jgi:hypothetical protein